MSDYQSQAQEEMWDAVAAQDAERTDEPKLYVTPEYWGTRPGYAVCDSNDHHLVKWFPVEELAEAERFAKEGV